MEKDLKHNQVFSWANAYANYKTVKKWAGETYRFGQWTIVGHHSVEVQGHSDEDCANDAAEAVSAVPCRRTGATTTSAHFKRRETAAGVISNERPGTRVLASDVATNVLSSMSVTEVQYHVTLFVDRSVSNLLQPTTAMLRYRTPSAPAEETIFLHIERFDHHGASLSVALDGDKCIHDLERIEFKLQQGQRGLMNTHNRRQSAISWSAPRRASHSEVLTAYRFCDATDMDAEAPSAAKGGACDTVPILEGDGGDGGTQCTMVSTAAIPPQAKSEASDQSEGQFDTESTATSTRRASHAAVLTAYRFCDASDAPEVPAAAATTSEGGANERDLPILEGGAADDGAQCKESMVSNTESKREEDDRGQFDTESTETEAEHKQKMTSRRPTARGGDRKLSVVAVEAMSHYAELRREAIRYPYHKLAQHVAIVSAANYEFSRKLLAECDKVEAFYTQQSTSWSRELYRLLNKANKVMEDQHQLTLLIERRRQHHLVGDDALEVLTGDSAVEVTVTPFAEEDTHAHRIHWTKLRERSRRLAHELEWITDSLRRMYYAYSLLLRFVEQNSEGIEHLVTKVEKRSQQIMLEPFLNYLETTYRFFAKTREGGANRRHPIQSLLDFMENRYIELTNGDKKGASKALHLKDEMALAKNRIVDSTLVGVMVGLSIGCVAMSFVEQDFMDTSVSVTTFAGLNSVLPTKILYLTGLLTLLAVLFSVNIVVWDSVAINYAFIFCLDDRAHWDGPRLMRTTMRYATLWSCGLFAYSRLHTLDTLAAWKPYVPFILLIGMAAMAVWDILSVKAAAKNLVASQLKPLVQTIREQLKVGGANTDGGKPLSSVSGGGRRSDSDRGWLLVTLWHIIAAPLYSVSFSDFYIADQLTSLTGFFGQIQSLLCMMVGNQSFKFPLLAAMPHVWRLLQCLRRWNDGPGFTVLHPNVSNALKYCAGLFQIFAAYNFDLAYSAAVKRADGSIDWSSSVHDALLLWVLAGVIEYCFKCFWDLYMDAGMFQVGLHAEFPCLRKRIMYRQEAYWAFAGMNLSIRFSTLFRIIAIRTGSSMAKINPVFFWALEVCRRAVWNFFRVENEQVSNTEKYRAVDLIPPVWSSQETLVLDAIDDQFAALWGNGSSADLPPKHHLFDRLPAHHKRCALNALYFEQSHRTELLTDNVWALSNAEALRIFQSLHHEDQVRVLYFAIGHETVEDFLKRFPADGKDAVGDAADTFGMTEDTVRSMGDMTSLVHDDAHDLLPS